MSFENPTQKELFDMMISEYEGDVSADHMYSLLCEVKTAWDEVCAERDELIHHCEMLRGGAKMEKLDSLQARLKLAEDTLLQIDAEWCKHPSIRLVENTDMHRDWCGECGEWIYRGKVNPAKQYFIDKDKI
jgi:hypothetical protein